MVTVNGRPFKIVEDLGFRKLLNPISQALSDSGNKICVNAETIREEVVMLASKIKKEIKEDIPEKFISLKIDIATRMDRAILGINIQLIKNGKLTLRTIAMKELTHPANNAMQGPQRPCTGNCAGPVRAARTGPVSIWPRAPKWPYMGLTARVSWRLNADFLHDVFWRCNVDFLHRFHDGLLPISCTGFMVVQHQLSVRFSRWCNADFLHRFHDGLMPISCTVFMMV